MCRAHEVNRKAFVKRKGRCARPGCIGMMMELAAQGYTAPLALIPGPAPAPTLGLPDDVPFSSLDSGQRQLRINTWISSLFNHAEGAPPDPYAMSDQLHLLQLHASWRRAAPVFVMHVLTLCLTLC